MATMYEDWMNRIGIGAGTPGAFSNELAPGEYVAYGTTPARPTTPMNLTTNVPQVANAPIMRGQNQMIPSREALRTEFAAPPQIQRSQMSALNIPVIPRPTEDLAVNPSGRAMTATEAMIRRQALDGVGMSVAQRNAIRGQIQSEAGQGASQRESEAEVKRIKEERDYQIKLREAGPKVAAQSRKELEQMKQTGKATIEEKKQLFTLQRDEALAKLKSKDRAEQLQGQKEMLQINLDWKAAQDKAQGKDVFSPEWEAEQKADLIKQGVKDEAAMSRVLFNTKAALIKEAVGNFEMSQAQGQKLLEAEEAKLNKPATGQSATATTTPGIPAAPTITPEVIASAQKLIGRIVPADALEAYVSGAWTDKQYKDYQLAQMIDAEQKKQLREQVKNSMKK